jgi:cytochrome b pre-mRNA-processing protein 3
MKNYYLHLYNNLIKLTSNKFLYNSLENQDTFSDRLTFFLFHFAFFLKNFKKPHNEKTLQDIYDFNFRQLELSIREIGYGDQSINKKMKNYINLFHSFLSEIHFWDTLDDHKKSHFISKFLPSFKNVEFLVTYFDDYNINLKKYDLNSYLKSVKDF